MSYIRSTLTLHAGHGTNTASDLYLATQAPGPSVTANIGANLASGMRLAGVTIPTAGYVAFDDPTHTGGWFVQCRPQTYNGIPLGDSSSVSLDVNTAGLTAPPFVITQITAGGYLFPCDGQCNILISTQSGSLDVTSATSGDVTIELWTFVP